MRTLLLSAALLLAAPQQPSLGGIPQAASGVTITPVGTPSCTDGPYSQSATVNYTPHASGDTIVVGATSSGALTSASVVDNATGGSTTYSQLSPASGNVIASEWGTLSVKSGVTTITVSNTTVYGLQVCISEYSGPVAFGNIGNGSFTSSPYSFSLTTQDPNNYAVLFCGDGAVAATGDIPVATAGTVRAYNTSDIYELSFIQDNTAATAGSVTVSGTIAGATPGGNCRTVELRTL